MEKIRHLQFVILSIMKDIDKLCKENEITYYLDAGSVIGAVRHQGFIPWDDDLDIIMDHNNYKKFIEVCREKLDNEKYYFQEGLIDWPLDFTQIRLRGTSIEEIESSNGKCNGIYIDVFRADNISNNKLIAYWQYFCAKVLLCYQLNKRTYNSAPLFKKILMFLSFPLKLKFIRNFFYAQTQLYNNKQTNRVCNFFAGIGWKGSVFNRNLYGTPKYVKFEDSLFPIQENYHEYLTRIYGNYMELPPINERKPKHITNIDFGKY